MKKTLVLLTAACIGFTSCQKNQSTATISKEEASKAVAELFDGFNSSIKGRDISTMGNFLSDDGLYLGTDPEEFWGKQKFVEEFGKIAKDTTMNLNFNIDKREIRVSSDGMMAVVIDQTLTPGFSKIPFRMIGHAVMKEGQWKIDFYSFNLVPTNENLGKVNEAYH